VEKCGLVTRGDDFPLRAESVYYVNDHIPHMVASFWGLLYLWVFDRLQNAKPEGEGLGNLTMWSTAQL